MGVDFNTQQGNNIPKEQFLVNIDRKKFFEALPKMGEQDDKSDPILYKKLKSIVLDWNWYIWDGEIETGIMFGYVEGFESECGSMSFDELMQIGVYEVKDFTPTPLSEIQSAGAVG